MRRDVLRVSCDTPTSHFTRSARSREGRALGSAGSRLSRPPFLGVPWVRCLCTPRGARLPRGANTWCEAPPDPETATGHDADTHARADRLDFIFPGGTVTETVIKGPKGPPPALGPVSSILSEATGPSDSGLAPAHAVHGKCRRPTRAQRSHSRSPWEGSRQSGTAGRVPRLLPSGLTCPCRPCPRPAGGLLLPLTHSTSPLPPRSRQWSFLALGKGRGELRGCRGPTQSCALADSRRGNHL